MNLFKQFNSIFHKLIISYIVLIIIITLILGSTSYFYFTSSFNHEIEKVHKKILEQVSNTLNTRITEVAVNNYMELVTEFISNTDLLFRFEEPLTGNHIKILRTYEYLQKIVAGNSSIISGIHIYYKKQNMIISSSLGIKYLNEEQRQHYKNLDWIQMMEESEKSNLWIKARKIPTNMDFDDSRSKVDLFTYVRTYPIISNGTNYEGLIAIDIEENIFSSIITRTVPTEHSNTFIIDHNGVIISHPKKDKLYDILSKENYITRILNSTKAYDSIIGKANNVRSMISFTTLPHTNWKLINITPLTQFYRRTAVIKQVLLIVCLISIALGVTVASIFSRRIYNPLGTMLEKVRLLLGTQDTPAGRKENEYAVINHAIDDLSLKVNNLQTTLQANKPIIKHNLIMGLLHHQILDEAEVKEKLRLINMTMDFPHYAAMVLEINPKDAAQLTIENSHFIKYNLIHEIEGYTNNTLKCIAADLPEHQIGIIIGSRDTDIRPISAIVSNLTSYTYNNFMIMATAALGNWQNSLLDIHESYKQTNLLFKYKYFYPRISLLTGSRLLSRENSIQQIPNTIVDDFLQGLKLRNLAKVKGCMNTFKKLTQKENYAADHCQQKIVEFIHTLSTYIKDMHYELVNSEKSDLYAMFNKITNITEFENWVISFVDKVFNDLDKQNDNRNSEVIELTKRYIYDHLADDLSLDRVAEYTNISASYLSKIFKDETGVNFVAFIKELRLEKAKELLLDTELPVQQIGFNVGYNTPAYFIQQFKAKYGYTPNDFRKKHNKK